MTSPVVDRDGVPPTGDRREIDRPSRTGTPNDADAESPAAERRWTGARRGPEPADGHARPGPDLARVVLTVQSCPLVAGVHAGRRGAITTTTRHGRLVGVFLHGTVLIVGVIAGPEGTDSEVIAEARAAVVEQLPHLVVVVVLIDRLRRVPDPRPVRARRAGVFRRTRRTTTARRDRTRPLPTIARSAVRRWAQFLQLVALTSLGAIVLVALAGAALLAVLHVAG